MALTLEVILEREVLDYKEFITFINLFLEHLETFYKTNNCALTVHTRGRMPVNESSISKIMKFFLSAQKDAMNYTHVCSYKTSVSYYNLPPEAEKFMKFGSNDLLWFPRCLCNYIEN